MSNRKPSPLTSGPARQTRVATGNGAPAVSVVQAMEGGDASAVYGDLYNASPLERLLLVKAGVPAGVLISLAQSMGVPRDVLYRWMGLARATANRKVKDDARLSQDESERALGILKLIGQVERIVADSGSAPAFDAARWTATWLDTANAALGGRKPGDFVDTVDGRALLSGLIGQMQSGAYA